MIAPGEPLAHHTTLGVGGPSEAWARVDTPEGLRQALDAADRRGWAVRLLGGGSNLLVADRGVDGLVIQYLNESLKESPQGSCTHVEVGAGYSWDRFVAWTVERRLAGVECLSGIPGRVGAAPLQNVGAYGQEVADTLVSVRALDRRWDAVVELPAEACGFAYRDSRFKGVDAGRFVVLAVTFALRPGGAPTLRYGGLGARLGPAPSLRAVRDEVLAVRRSKAMVLDAGDPDSRSAGSFFTNPILPESELPPVLEQAARLRPGVALPRWSAEGGVKLPAAWLIEAAGVRRGEQHGGAGISTKHTLALVNRGDATAADLVGLAASVRARVRDAFGVALDPEPRFWGFDQPGTELLEHHS